MLGKETTPWIAEIEVEGFCIVLCRTLSDDKTLKDWV